MSAAFTALLILFLLRALEPKAYGVFALAMSVGGIVNLVSNLGINNAAGRFVAESRRDRAALLGVVSDALRIKLIVSGLFSAALAAAADLIAAAYSTPELALPIRILALSVFGESLFAFLHHISVAVGRVPAYLRVVGAEGAIEATASIALVLGGFGVAGAVAGRAVAYLFGAAFGFVLFVRILHIRPRLRGRTAGNVRRIARYGSALLVVDAAFVLFGSIDVLLIGAIISVTAVGQFQAPMRLLVFIGYAGAAVASGVAPRLTRGSEGANTRALNKALRRLMALQGVFVAPLVVWAEPLTTIVIGKEYAASADVVRAIAPYAFLIGVSPVLAQGVTYLGEARLRIPIAIGALLVNLVFDLVMLPRIGIVAGAYGTDIAYGFYVTAHLWICRRLLRIPLRPLALTLVRVTVAAAVMSVVLVMVGTGDVAFPLLVVGGTAGALAYAATLLLIRELRIEDLRHAQSRLAAAIPRLLGRAG